MNDKEYDELKKILPIEMQEHFEKNRGIFDRNTAKLEELKSDLPNVVGSQEAKAITNYIVDLTKEQYRIADTLMDHSELSYIASFILRKKLDEIEKTLGDHGIMIDHLVGYDGILKWIDNYIKHSSEDKKIE